MLGCAVNLVTLVDEIEAPGIGNPVMRVQFVAVLLELLDAGRLKGWISYQFLPRHADQLSRSWHILAFPHPPINGAAQQVRRYRCQIASKEGYAGSMGFEVSLRGWPVAEPQLPDDPPHFGARL